MSPGPTPAPTRQSFANVAWPLKRSSTGVSLVLNAPSVPLTTVLPKSSAPTTSRSSQVFTPAEAAKTKSLPRPLPANVSVSAR